MRKSLSILIALLAACSDSEGQTARADPALQAKTDIAREVQDATRPASRQRAPKWRFEYRGDLNGSIEGSILTAMTTQAGGSPRVTLAGGAMTPDRKAQATQSFNGTVMTFGDNTVTTIRVVLADGTQCQVDSTAPATFRVVDAERETFHAELAGTLKCGEGRASFDAVFRKKP
jgi:hypothetical protein